ncbi:uncharacterized protein LOC141533612 [Cotesia typhae]|uniref:uncharacterized protein LOC141533612 n=1 Tax=Cotesia typhae TaxID=2053667 RepID=UPI003D6877E5
MLIEEYRTNENNFTTGKISQKKLWKNVSDQLNTYGHKITGPQCQSKFSGLKRTYKKIKDHNNKSGNSAKTWPYFTLMDDLLGAKPNITPTATCSLTGKRTRSNSTCSSVSSENELDETATIVKKSKSKQPINKLLDVLEERSSIQETNKDCRFRELLEFKERKMEENLELKKRAVELLAQIVNRQQKF